MDLFFCGPHTDLLIRAHTQEYVPYRVVVDDVVHKWPLSTSLNVGTLWFWPSDRSPWLIVARRFLVASCWHHRAHTHTYIFVFIGVQPLAYSPNRCSINIAVLTLESPSSYLLAWRKGNSIIRLRHRLAVRSSSLALHWSPSSNDRQCCLKHGMKQRSPTNAIPCTFRLSTRLLMWFWFISCTKLTWMYACAADTRISLSHSRFCCTQCVVITLLLYSSWYWYWWWYWWCAHIIPSSIHLQGSRARASGE